MVSELYSYTKCDAKQESKFPTENLQLREILNTFYVAIVLFITLKTLFLLSDSFLKTDFDWSINYLYDSLS